MAAKKQIIVEIDTDAQVTVMPHGWTGKACEAATAELEGVLGTRRSHKRTAEFRTKEQKHTVKQ